MVSKTNSKPKSGRRSRSRISLSEEPASITEISLNKILAERSTKTVIVGIEGTAAMIHHRFGKKAQEELLVKHIAGAKAKAKKKPKDPVRNAIEGVHFMDRTVARKIKIPSKFSPKLVEPEDFLEPMPLDFLEGIPIGFKASGIKKAIVRAGKPTKFVMKDLNCGVYIHTSGDHPDLVEVEYSGAPVMRCDALPMVFLTEGGRLGSLDRQTDRQTGDRRCSQ